MKANSPLLGFNNNVKHKGRVFHVQTEDSGVKHPHVITHLFVDGGRILKSIKTSYAEFVEDEDLKQKVRLLMQEQHKAMFIALRAGKFDQMVEGGDAPPPPPPSSQAALDATAAQLAGIPAGVAEVPDEVRRDLGAPASSPVSASLASAPISTPAASVPAPVPSSPRESPVAEAQATAQATVPAVPSSGSPSEGARAASAVRPVTNTPAARPATQPPSSGGPVSLRPPSLMPPPPRAPMPSVNSERASFTNERGSTAGPTFGGAAERPPPASRQADLRQADLRQADSRAETLQTVAAEPHRPRLASPLELNLEALERSAAEPRSSMVTDGDVRDLPPPPAGVLGRRPATINTSYRSIQHTDPRAEQASPDERPSRSPTMSRGSSSGDAPPASVRSPSPAPSLVPPTSRPRTMPMPQPSAPPAQSGRSVAPPTPRSLTPQGARYAASRPASIFGSARPQEGSSIFGEDLISEKSLDEVILSYLAEDLEGAKSKR